MPRQLYSAMSQNKGGRMIEFRYFYYLHSIVTRLAQDGWIGDAQSSTGEAKLISHRADFRDIAYVAKRIGWSDNKRSSAI